MYPVNNTFNLFSYVVGGGVDAEDARPRTSPAFQHGEDANVITYDMSYYGL